MNAIDLFQIEPTTRCNLNCWMCPGLSADIAEKDLSLDVFCRVLEQTKGIPKLLFTGLGEPLLNPLLPSMMAQAKQDGRHCAIITNGHLLTTDMIH